MPIRGYADRTKTAEGKPDYTTVNPVKFKQFGADVIAHAFVQLITADAVEAGSTTRVINATAHSAIAGDLIAFTSGAQNTLEVRVIETTANTITLAEELAAAPLAAVTFQILRQKQPVVNASGGISIAGSIPSSAGRSYVDSVRNDYSAVNVTAGAWVQLVAALPSASNGIFLFDSSGQTLELGTGAAAAETRVLIIPPGGIDGFVPIAIAAAARVAIRAISAAANSGEINITFLS